MLQRLLLCACLLLNAAAHAGTEKAACTNALDAVIGRFVGQPELRSPQGTWGGLQNGTPVVQSVCQRHPAKPDFWQVVYVIERSKATDEPYQVDVVIALIHLKKRQVVASTKDLLEPDGISDDRMGLRFGSPLGLPEHDLQLLKLPNRLPKCADGYVGDESTVYLKKGKHLVPVIDGLRTYNEWWGSGSCNDGVITETTQRRLSRGTTTTHGMPDAYLKITARHFHEKTGKLSQIQRTKFLLRYNGQRYEPSSEKLRLLEDCWLKPDQAFCKKPPTHQKAKP
jgi:hypothetical protein